MQLWWECSRASTPSINDARNELSPSEDTTDDTRQHTEREGEGERTVCARTTDELLCSIWAKQTISTEMPNGPLGGWKRKGRRLTLNTSKKTNDDSSSAWWVSAPSRAWWILAPRAVANRCHHLSVGTRFAHSSLNFSLEIHSQPNLWNNCFCYIHYSVPFCLQTFSATQREWGEKTLEENHLTETIRKRWFFHFNAY